VAQGHLALFVRTVGILETLRPQVFGMEGMAVLLGMILDPLDAAAQASSTAARDHLVPFVSQTAAFLAHAAMHDTALLTPHGAVLKHISMAWPAVPKLAAVSRCVNAQTGVCACAPEGDGTASHREVESVRARLCAVHSEGVSALVDAEHALAQLEQASRQEPQILLSLLEELLGLTSTGLPVMAKSYTLLVKMLSADAEAADRVSRQLVINLMSRDETVARAAEGAAVDLYPYLGAMRQELLMRLFDAGQKALPTLSRIVTMECQ